VTARTSLFSFLLLVGWAPSAWGQANYESALIGGRSSLMGGTGVAAGTDAAAPLQNPATTVGIEGTSFVFSTFFLQITNRNVQPDLDRIAEVERGQAMLDQFQFRVLPNSTCLFFDLRKVPGQVKGHHKGSICLAEPETQTFELTTSVVGESTSGRSGFQQRFVSQVYSKKVYSVGWATSLSENVSIGVNPMLEEVGFRDVEGIGSVLTDDASLADAIGSSGQSVTSIMTRKASAFAVSALVGVRWRLNEDFSLGASFHSPSWHITGGYTGTRSSEAISSPTEQYAQETGSARFTYPLRLALGVAGRIKGVRFEANAFYHEGRSDFAQIQADRTTVTVDDGVIAEATKESIRYQEAVRPVANVGLGVDIPLNPSWSLVSGVLTDFGGLRSRQNGSLVDETLFRNRLDAVHGSVGVAWTPRAGSLLLGVRGFYGQGEMAVADPRTIPPLRVAAPQSQWGLALVVSGQITLELLAAADPTGLVKKAAGTPAPAEPPAD